MASFKKWLSLHPACKRIQDSLVFSILHREFRIPSTWFQSSSVELDSRFESLVGFRIPQSKFPEFQILNFHKQKFSGIRITIHEATTGLRDVALPQRWRQLKRHWKLTSRPRPNSERYSKIYASCRSRPRENLRIGHFTSELFLGQRDLATWYR